jgi:predicted component of type VI protein secretion system
MIESFQDVQVISAMDHIGGVQFVQPTYACPAPILPTLYSVHVKQISKNLEAAKKQLVVLSERDRTESWVDRGEPTSHVLPQKPTMAFFSKSEAHAGFQWKEVDVIRLHENILSFVIRRLKCHASDSSPGRNANTR